MSFEQNVLIAWDPDPNDWLNEERLGRLRDLAESVGSLLREADTWEETLQYWVRKEISLLNRAGASINSSPKDLKVATEIACQEWAQECWGHLIHTLFLSQKNGLDKAQFGLIRMKDKYLAQEVYHRIKAKEVDFRVAAFEFGDSHQGNIDGILPLQRIREIPLGIGSIAREMRTGDVKGPMKLGKGYCVIKLFSYENAVCDEDMQKLLLHERMRGWVDEVVKKINTVFIY